jgi:hypothetical protein
VLPRMGGIDDDSHAVGARLSEVGGGGGEERTGCLPLAVYLARSGRRDCFRRAASNFIAQLSIRSPHFLKLDTPDLYDASCARHPARTEGW